MVSVILSTEDDERAAVATLSALVPGAAAGVIRDVQMVTQRRSEALERLADVAGCQLLVISDTRGRQLAAAAQQARSPWLLFLRAGAVPQGGWIDELAQFIENAPRQSPARAAVFRYERSPYAGPSTQDAAKTIRRWLCGPSPDQGLMIARSHYDALGGHDPASDRAEEKLLARLGRKQRILLRSRIIMDA